MAGSLRGLGGISALLVGVSLAPVIGRASREHAADAAHVFLGLSTALGATGNFFALASF